MRDPVTIVHDETDKTTVVPRGQVNALASAGWRLASEPEPIRQVDVSTPGEFMMQKSAVDDVELVDDDELETYERVTSRFDSPDES